MVHDVMMVRGAKAGYYYADENKFVFCYPEGRGEKMLTYKNMSFAVCQELFNELCEKYSNF